MRSDFVDDLAAEASRPDVGGEQKGISQLEMIRHTGIGLSWRCNLSNRRESYLFWWLMLSDTSTSLTPFFISHWWSEMRWLLMIDGFEDVLMFMTSCKGNVGQTLKWFVLVVGDVQYCVSVCYSGTSWSCHQELRYHATWNLVFHNAQLSETSDCNGRKISILIH